MGETLPPRTAKDIELQLANATVSVYLYVGAADDDEAWEIAEALEGLLAALRVYLAKKREPVAKWLPDDATVGVVFDWSGAVFAHLDQAQAEDMLLVLNTITAARKKR